jgi:hypothetical protein
VFHGRRFATISSCTLARLVKPQALKFL